MCFVNVGTPTVLQVHQASWRYCK